MRAASSRAAGSGFVALGTCRERWERGKILGMAETVPRGGRAYIGARP
jgi:hypothetical protein